MRRRDCLRFLALAGAAPVVAGCSRVIHRATAPPPLVPPATPPGGTAPAARLLNRAGFGPSPADMARLAELGAEAYVNAQLDPDAEDDSRLKLRLRGIEALATSAVPFPGAEQRTTNAVELQDVEPEEVLRQLQQALLLRAVYSRHQLLERMVDFWSNHFNIYAHKGQGTYYLPSDSLRVVRRNALSGFPGLVRASAHSPAMLMYLDNQSNARGVPNENYARELMELHTLGIHGGYTQRDVQEVARCFTGWTVEDRFLKRRGTFRFDASRHDDGAKTVLGVRLPAGGGKADGDRVLDILIRHPSTARHIAGKLCRFFLGEEDAAWTDRIAGIFTRTEGSIPHMLRPLLLSRDLLDSPPILKRPFDFVVSSLRALRADTDGGSPLQAHLAAMGQPLYQWPMPDGYPDRMSAWTGSLLPRWNFAMALCANGIAGSNIDVAGLDCAALRELAMPGVTAEARHGESRDPLSRFAAPEAAALLLASPGFQWR